MLSLIVELIEEKEVLELEPEEGNNFVTFDNDVIDDDPTKE